ncbi:MAG: 30S ribosomal protein S12 methylthiotransferase RimO [Candidatus Gracilibacteria bacterium]|jgi:ribosomal protein S12 methylthiotransferase
MNTIKISAVSLGCPKNLADTESILSTIKDIQIVSDSDAKYIFLNTCGFLKSARDEVYENINKFKKKKVILLGCLASQFTKEDFQKYPQVYAIVSSANYFKIDEIFKKVIAGEKVYSVSTEPKTFEKMAQKKVFSSPSFAYIKIAEGCNNACSYCYIPYLKGRYRSRKMPEILSEAKFLIKQGIKELILVAQDCGCYGIDIYGSQKLPELLKKLSKTSGDFLIRILYVYPERVSKELLDAINSSDKICKYLDIPLQHGDKEILKKMLRPNDPQKILQKISNIRKEISNIILRTSFIVGFPGETEKQFKTLLEFIKKINFDHVGVFEYSREPHTKAYFLKPQVSEKIKSIRCEKAMKLQQKISLEKNKKLIGTTQKVLLEKYDKEANLYVGRSQKFAPEIDGEIIIKSKLPLKLNDFYDVKIISATDYDLEGELL